MNYDLNRFNIFACPKRDDWIWIIQDCDIYVGAGREQDRHWIETTQGREVGHELGATNRIEGLGEEGQEVAATHTIKGAGAERQEVAVTHRIKEMGEESEVEEHSEYNSNHYEGASTPRDDKVQGVH